MNSFTHLNGVYVAALTPLHADDTLALEDVLPFLRFLAGRGAHGALLMGTTGEGPSFAVEERLALLREALHIRAEFPDFRLFMGTGTPSLEETAALTRASFELGVDAVVVLPPYYIRNVSDEGLFAWFSRVIQRSVPAGGALLGYHIPPVSGVPLSMDLLARLKEAFPDRFAGIKDSSADPEQARLFGERFGDDLLVFSGTDSLFSLALDHSAGGCITAMSNICSPDLRLVWNARFGNGDGDVAVDAAASAAAVQERLTALRDVMKRYPPNPSIYKGLVARLHGFPRWPVRLPLLPLNDERVEQAVQEAQLAAPFFAN
jgi:4-hydroxy-tetrahydrodipicolinate synthase